MLFKRRNERTAFQIAREYVWPTGGYRRALTYLWHRLSRMQATPHAIAIGFACGAFASFTPLVGLHFLLAGVFAWMVRGQIVAALVGTAIGNPVTFPFIWAWVYQLGSNILGREILEGVPDPERVPDVLSTGIETALDIFVPMMIGGIPSGIVAGLVCYFPVKFGIDRYQTARRTRLRLGGTAPVSGSDSEVAG